MKTTKKVFAVMAAMVMGVSVFAQEFSFENEVATDVVYIDSFEDENNFAGFAEKATFEFKSDKVDAGLSLKFNVSPAKIVDGDNYTTDHIAFHWDYSKFDYYIEIRPFKILTVGLHDNVFMYGAYLPVYDDNLDIAPANLGSRGFSLFFRPIGGLRIAATIPFEIFDENFLNGAGDDGEPHPFDIGFGLDYTNNLFSLGAKVSDVADSDEIGFGVYGMLMPTNLRIS